MTFFILGSHPKLSVAEIFSVVRPSERVTNDFENTKALVLDNVNQTLEELQNRLAGTIKIGQIITQFQSFNIEKIAQSIAEIASSAGGKQKISFGLSAYPVNKTVLSPNARNNIKTLGIQTKKLLKQTGRPVRFVSAKEPQLSSVIVRENKLLESGGEFVLLIERNGYALGQTKTVQDYKDWSARDYGRPSRDAKSGMLPPKLARMMLNLSKKSPPGPILDPFCGSGTVLMEAVMLGFTQIIGSDISKQAIENTRKNLAWLHTKKGPPGSILETLYNVSAQNLGSHISKPVDVIVTEVFLGAPRTNKLAEYEIKKTVQELMRVYEPSFYALRKLLKKDGKAVVAFPAFVLNDNSLFNLPLKPMLKKAGFSVTDSFIYKRPNQFVAREILVIKPQP